MEENEAQVKTVDTNEEQTNSKFEELKLFIDQTFDQYRQYADERCHWTEFYEGKMNQAVESIKEKIAELFPGVKASEEILHSMKWERKNYHSAVNKDEHIKKSLEAGNIGWDTRVFAWNANDLSNAKGKYEIYKDWLMEAMKVAEKVNPESPEEQLLDELEEKNGPKRNDYYSICKEGIVEFSNPLLQAYFKMYCDNKEKNNRISELEEAVEQRDEIIHHDTATINTLAEATGEYRGMIVQDKEILQIMTDNLSNVEGKVENLNSMYQAETQKGIFKKISDKIKGLFSKTPMLPEAENFESEVNATKSVLSGSNQTTENRIGEIENASAIQKLSSKIANLMSMRTKLLGNLKSKEKSDKNR